VQVERKSSFDSDASIQVQDAYPIYIDDLAVPASRKIAARFSRLLPGYDLRETRSYDPRYLASWPAEVYDIPMADASLEAREQAYAHYKRILPARIPDLFNLRTTSEGPTIESFKLVLLPVWITEIPLDGKGYTLLVNGQNGQVEGDTPAKPKAGLLEWLKDILDD